MIYSINRRFIEYYICILAKYNSFCRTLNNFRLFTKTKTMRKAASVCGILFAAIMLFCAVHPNLFLSRARIYTFSELSERKGEAVSTQESGAVETASFPNLKSLFSKKKPDEKEPGLRLEEVYLGGMPIGMTMHAKGVIVLGIGSVLTKDGTVKPFAAGRIKEGDVITDINGAEILSVEDIHRIINLPENAGKEVTIGFTRRGKEMTETAVPALDTATKSYKLGLWIRDNAAGVGTVTYIKKDGRFGALGHPICDADVGGILPIRGGNAYKCNIVGVIKGQKGTAGELRGLFLKNKTRLGTIDANNRFGVFGKFDEIPRNKLYPQTVKCATRDMIKAGPASIVATTGEEICEYKIEIIKTNFQSAQSEKSMVIRVTDERLLAETGGIVQGMSGSPIMQDGRLCGAVTHVFINDPSKGFAVYTEWMLNN